MEQERGARGVPGCHHRVLSPRRTFNDESPLGIRRILSQSTDSLNMRNRTLSVESLIDEGGTGTRGHGGTRGAGTAPSASCPPGPDVVLNQLLSDLEADGKDFEADSWSLAVDNSFLQQHKMDVMKRQDVIYGEGQRGRGHGGTGCWGQWGGRDGVGDAGMG